MDLLTESIRSLRGTAHNNTEVEILIAADEDDNPTVENAGSLCQSLIVTPRFGYSRLNMYYNLLAKEARGQWLVLWNDDAVMLTDEWDRILHETPEGVLIADLQSQHTSTGLCCFPAVRRKAVAAVGGFSPHTPHCDTYWQDIGRATGCIRTVDIHLDHRRYDLSGVNGDTTWIEGQQSYQTGAYYGPEVQRAIAQDIETIRRLL